MSAFSLCFLCRLWCFFSLLRGRGGGRGTQALPSRREFEERKGGQKGVRASCESRHEEADGDGARRPPDAESSEWNSPSFSHALTFFPSTVDSQSFEKHRNNNAWLRRRLLEGAFGVERAGPIGEKKKVGWRYCLFREGGKQKMRRAPLFSLSARSRASHDPLSRLFLPFSCRKTEFVMRSVLCN